MLIDDFSRYIVDFKIGQYKNAQLVLECFEESVSSVGRAPLIYWSDNGLENLAGIVQDYLRSHNIKHIRTKPRNPQSNGKIERFWPTLEGAIRDSTSREDLENKTDEFILFYNNYRPRNNIPI